MSDFLALFSLPFMQRALLAALLTGLAAPAIGTFLVQRRLALLGDGIGHVAVTGVAIGLLTDTSPTWTAVVVAVLGAVLIEVIRERGLQLESAVVDLENADDLLESVYIAVREIVSILGSIGVRPESERQPARPPSEPPHAAHPECAGAHRSASAARISAAAPF